MDNDPFKEYINQGIRTGKGLCRAYGYRATEG